jgi:chitin disaccharide deacetylase
MAKSDSARLILCADDYAIAPGVSRAIRRLIEAGRLTATSCMTMSPYWPAEALVLRPLAERADIGVHLTLTNLRPLGAMPATCPGGRFPAIRDLTIAAWCRQLDLREIAAELTRQIDAFEAAFGRPPAFLDGHQHVHQLPGIRDVVIDIWERRLAGSQAWIRVTDEPLPDILRRGVERTKAAIVSLLGRGLGRRARALGIPVNDGFSGVQDFSGRIPYGRLFERFLEAPRGKYLVMCHPGEVDEPLRAADDVTHAREEELHFFESDAFPALVAQYGLVLGRF